MLFSDKFQWTPQCQSSLLDHIKTFLKVHTYLLLLCRQQSLVVVVVVVVVADRVPSAKHIHKV